MEVTSFADIQVEFTTRVSEAIYGVMATVDRKNRYIRTVYVATLLSERG